MNTVSALGHRERQMANDDSVLDRLREAGLRPTVARVTILQVMEAHSPSAISVDELFRLLLLRGTRTSVGTLYQTMRALCEKSLLVKEPNASQPALYRLRQAQRDDSGQIRLICSDSGQAVLLHDGELHARLLAAARRQGVDLSGRQLNLTYDRADRPPTDGPGHPHPPRPRLVRSP